MSNIPQSFINSLVQAGAFTTALAVQEAAAEQVNTATTGSTGTDAKTTNEAWGKAIPVLIGHTRTVCLPLWIGNPVANVSDNGDETDTIDFAVYVGRAGPDGVNATVLRIWFDNVLVYDVTDPTVTTLIGAALQFTFYDGTQKTVDPLIQADKGVATPAFTHTMYIVFSKLVTRVIDATTTTTQFSKLPEVQVELTQVQVQNASGFTYTAIPNAPVPNFSVYRIQLYSTGTQRTYVIESDYVQIFDVRNAVYLGRTSLKDFNKDNYVYASPMFFTEDELLIVCQYVGKHIRAYNMVDGTYIQSDDNLVTDNISVGVYLGDGYILCSDGSGKAVLFQFAENKFVLAKQDFATYSKANNDSGLNLALFNHNVPNTDVKPSYINPNYTTFIYMTLAGTGSAPISVGKITYDGSNRDALLSPGMHVSYVPFESGERILSIFMDSASNKYLYAIVTIPNKKPQLRTYGTFYYFNPQDGTATPVQPYYAYADPTFLSELSRFDLSDDLDLVHDAIFVDPHYPTIAILLGGSRGIAVINYRTQTVRIFKNGSWINSVDKSDKGTQALNYPLLMDFRTLELWFSNAVGTGKARINGADPAQSTPYSLATLYTDLCVLAGYDANDVVCANMDDVVTGLQLNQTVDFPSLIAQFNAAFRVDMVEQPDGSLSFNRRLNTNKADYVITPDLLLSADGNGTGNTVAIDRVATNELPTLLQLSFINNDEGYQVGAATVKRVTYPAPTAYGSSFLALSIPVVMSAQQASYYAGIALFDMWAGKVNFQINLPPMFFFIQPGDFLELIRPSGRADLCKVTEISLGTDRTIAVTLSGVGSLKPVPFMQAANTPGYVPVENLPASYGTFTTPSPAGLYATVIDNVYVPDAAAGQIPFYVVSNRPADVYSQAAGASPVKLGTTVAAIMGVATTQLSDPLNNVLTSTEALGVALIDGTQAIPPAGRIAIGAPGRWEVVDYAEAAQQGAAVTLSGLARGAQSTRSTTAGHMAGDTVVFLSAGLLVASLPIAQLDKSVTVYAMPPGSAPQPTGGVVDTLSVTGAAIKPLQPLFPQATRQDNGDVVVKWYRQDPNAPSDFFAPVPLTYAPEQYTITLNVFANGGASTRKVNVDGPSFVYTLAAQTADGNDKATRLNVSIAQLSAVVGAGIPFKGYVYVA